MVALDAFGLAVIEKKEHLPAAAARPDIIEIIGMGAKLGIDKQQGFSDCFSQFLISY